MLDYSPSAASSSLEYWEIEQGIAAQLGLRNPWQARDYIAAMRKYSAVKVMYIISDIRECDARSKGVGNPSTGSGDLLKELIYKILH